MSQTINEKALDYVETTGKALDLAQKMAEAQEAQRIKVAELAPKLAERLVDVKLIQPHEKAAAIESLSDPLRALSVIGNLVTYSSNQRTKAAAAASAQGNGQAVPSAGGKAASSVVSTEDNYVGRRRGMGKVAASDEALFRGLGLSAPSNS